MLALRGSSCGSLEALDAALNRNLWAHEAAAKRRSRADFLRTGFYNRRQSPSYSCSAAALEKRRMRSRQNNRMFASRGRGCSVKVCAMASAPCSGWRARR